jgi:hypothetical protein
MGHSPNFHFSHGLVFTPTSDLIPTSMAKKRKLSDLTTQETDMFLQMIETFKQALSEEDEDEKSVIASLDHVAAKLALGNVSAMKHVPFSSASSLTFAKAKIKAGPLTVISNKLPELKSLGLKEGVGSNRLTVNQTRDLISLNWAHVSFSVSIEIIISLFMHTVTFTQRQDVAYWSTRSYCMSYRI